MLFSIYSILFICAIKCCKSDNVTVNSKPNIINNDSTVIIKYTDFRKNILVNFNYIKDEPRENKELSIAKLPSIENFSFLISLQYDSGKGPKHVCSGTILSQLWVLSAAHCVCYTYTTNAVKAENISIVAGVPSLQREESYSIKAAEIFKHPEYRFDYLKNDIALIKLSSEIAFSETVQPIRFARDESWKGKDINELYDYCVAFDWYEDFINNVNMPIIPNSVCEGMISGVDLNTSHFCTFLNDTDDFCQMESGGPLLCGDEQVGVATFRLGCGYPDTPSVWTRVYDYKEWISNLTEIPLKTKQRLQPRRRPGGGRPGGGRPGGGSWGKPGGGSWGRPGGGKPGGGNWGKPGGGRPGEGRPGGSRPGGSSWGRPGGGYRPGYSAGRGVYGGRPGGSYSYTRVNVYSNRATYIRPYGFGGYGYYGIGYHHIGMGFGYPLGMWYGRPLLFFYRPWFFMDMFLTHMYIHNTMYNYHLLYGYGYGPYGYPRYQQSPPPTYCSSYCRTDPNAIGSDTKEEFMNKKCENDPGFYNATSNELCSGHKLFCNEQNQ